MTRLLVIADDFTGALDTGIKCTNAGLNTCVVPDVSYLGENAAEADVLVVNLPTRHCSKETAYAMVFDAVRSLAPNVPYILKKTDSALRGNIGSELAAALDASGERLLAFLPAFPQMRRTTKGGVHYFDGVPIHESAFGKDPFEPVRKSNVAEIIREQTAKDVRLLSAGALPPQEFCGIAVYDAESDGDIRLTVERLHADGRARIMAGCAALGAAVANMLACAGTVAKNSACYGKFSVVCGSVNPISARQIAYAEKNGFRKVLLSGEAGMDLQFCESDAYRALLRELCGSANARRPFILASGGCDGEDMQHADAIRGRLADVFGRVAQDVMDRDEQETLMVIGGDTLLALMKRLQSRWIQPLCELSPGVVLSAVDYRGKRRNIISKSGGFGNEDLIVRLASKAAAVK